MNIQTKDQMKKMKLTGMLRAFNDSLEQPERTSKLTTDEMISHLVQSEWDDRQDKRLSRNLGNARLRYNSSIEQIMFEVERNVDRNQMMRFCDCSFIMARENLFITGPTGIGKSYLASAIGYHACTQGLKVIYANTDKLMTKLKMAKADGSYIKEMARIERQDLLILDDFGIQPFDTQSRSTMMEIIEDRHGRRSTLVTSQVPVKSWHEIIGERTIADAILDRIVHNAHRLEMQGESMRKSINTKKMVEN